MELSGKAVQLAGNQGFQTRLSCSIHDLGLAPYFSYLPSSFPLTLSQGVADTELEIAFSPNREQGSRLSIDVKMSGSDLEMSGKENGLRLNLPHMDLEAALSPLRKQLDIKSLVTKGAHITGTQKRLADGLKTFFPLSPGSDLPGFELTISRLLLDQGRITLNGDPKNQKPDTTWETLQLSLTNYSSAHPSGTIQVSGKQSKDGRNFSWTGKVTEKRLLAGKLSLNAFPARDIFHFFLPDPQDTIQGTASFSGGLTFFSPNNGSASYSLDNAMLQFQNLKLIRDKRAWFEAGSVHLSRLSRSEHKFDLGNILVKEADLNLDTRKLPPLFSHLFTAKERPQIKKIDFRGDLYLTPENKQTKPLHLSDVHWQVSDLEEMEETENLAFAGLLPDGGRINAKGTLSLGPTRVESHISFTNVRASHLSPFFPTWPLFLESRGLLHGEGRYRFPAASFQGNLKLTDTLLQDGDKKPLISWDLAELSKLDCRFAPLSLQAETMQIEAPYIHWQRGSVPFSQQLQASIDSLFSQQSEQKGFVPLDIKKISFQNGVVTILDQRLSPPWKTTVNDIEGRINNFNTGDDGLSSFSLAGTVEDSPLNLAGTTTFFHTPPDSRIRLKLTGFPLVSLQKQLENTSINPENASLFLQMDIQENETATSGTSEMIFHNLRAVSDPSDTALALALLKDSEDNFPLTLPMDSSNQPLFEKSLNTFQTLLIKASYAPLLLEQNFADLHDNNLVLFHPGSDTLSATGKETLIRYAELLTLHPELGISITGMADGKTDREVIVKAREEKEQQRVDDENKRREEEYRKQQHPPAPAPDSTLQEEAITTEELNGFVPLLPDPVHVSDEELLDLARERTLVIYDFCIDTLGVAPNRIHLAEKGELSDSAPANGGRIGIQTIPKGVE